MMEMKQREYQTLHIELIPEVRFAEMSENQKLRKKPLKVLVLKGGTSSEREVSLESGHAIADALREKGYDVSEFDIRELTLTPEMKTADIVWPVLHGGFGEDGRIQKLLEDAHIPFVGSSSAACSLIMNKIESKKLMSANGIPNAKYAVVDPDHRDIPAGLKFPLVVKPVSEGSTYGLSVVDSPADWGKALELVFRYGKEALVEEFFAGVEVTLGIIAGKALPMIEIRYTTKVYDYDAKYLHKTCETQYLCHAPSVPEAIQEKLRAASLKFFQLSGAQDILRTDMMVNVQTGDFILLEGNSIPGCTANSLVPKAAKAMGMSFPDMCVLLVEGAASRYAL
ncbi:MAG: D-alanine--D-alanine ligase [Lentisphaeria bacterium]|nr:D-alanine--D-alanine ligase [Lentisphaeria bacterium]